MDSLDIKNNLSSSAENNAGQSEEVSKQASEEDKWKSCQSIANT